MNKALIPVLAIAAIAGCVFSISQMNARKAADAAVAEREREIGEAKSSLQKIQKNLNERSKELGEVEILRANVARLTRERDEALEKAKKIPADGDGSKTPGPGATAAGGPQPQLDFRGMLGNFAKGFDDPEQRKVFKAMQERLATSAYDQLFKKLGLSEQDSKLVAEIIGERNFMAMDKGRKILSGKPDDAALAAVRKDVEATKAEYDSKLRAVLGAEKFGELGAYEQGIGDQRTLERLSRDFERKGQPLEEQQRESLARIMREERMKSPGNEIPDLGGGPGMQLLMNDAEIKAQQQEEEQTQKRVLARSSEAGLSLDQVNTLQESYKQRNEWRTFGRAMGRAFILPQK